MKLLGLLWEPGSSSLVDLRPCCKTKQIKKGLGGSRRTLAKKRERRMEGEKRDSSPSTEKREWRADENGTLTYMYGEWCE
jgi:hypothetical protein